MNQTTHFALVPFLSFCTNSNFGKYGNLRIIAIELLGITNLFAYLTDQYWCVFFSRLFHITQIHMHDIQPSKPISYILNFSVKAYMSIYETIYSYSNPLSYSLLHLKIFIHTISLYIYRSDRWTDNLGRSEQTNLARPSRT